MNLIDEEIKRKLNFLRLAKEINNICKAARITGFSQPTYYKLKKIYEAEGEEGLRKRIKRKPKLSKIIEEEVLTISENNPKWGSLRIHEELKFKGIEISERATYDILRRNGLNLRSKRLEKFKKNNSLTNL